MATKASERAREWLQTQPFDEIDLAESEALDVPGLLERYEAATIERCAQIAETYAEKGGDSSVKHLREHGAAWTAAAIRSMGEQNE